ncbi:MAG: KGK domain-containing protein [Cyanobacteria bacterium P01_H01_bin.35]
MKLNGGLRVEDKVGRKFNSSKWESVTEEIEYQLLKLGDSGWQKGRLRVKNYVDFLPEENRGCQYSSKRGKPAKSELKIELEFCPDLTIESESPLDDIRC